MENLLFMAYHESILDGKGKVSIPACIVIIKEVNEVDCFGETLIAKLEQRYARPNKKLGKIISLDNFKGKQGISQNLYSESDIVNHLKLLVDDNYHIQRQTKYLSNALAERVFKEINEYNLKKLRENGGFKLPS